MEKFNILICAETKPFKLFDKKCWAWEFFFSFFSYFLLHFLFSRLKRVSRVLFSTEPQFGAKNRWNFIYDNTFLRRVVTCEMNHFFHMSLFTVGQKQKHDVQCRQMMACSVALLKSSSEDFKQSLKGNGKRFASKVSSDAEAAQNRVRQIILRLVYLLSLAFCKGKRFFRNKTFFLEIL